MPARYEGTSAAVALGSEETTQHTGMSDTATVYEHGPYVLLILASLIIGFMPFLLINLVQPSVQLLPFLQK
jgi:hypothetical protein